MAKQSLLYSSVFLLMLALAACKKNDNLEFEKPIISLRTEWGWCGRGDSLLVSQNASVWIHYPSSCNDEQRQKQQYNTEESDYQELLDILKQGDFTKLNINDCGVCTDGVTFTITVSTEEGTHAISIAHYTLPGTLEQQNGMARKLRDKLLEILVRYDT